MGWSGRRGVAQEGVLGDLAPAAGPLAGRQGRRVSVSHSTALGLPEGADEVLALGQVDPGLAADGRVDLGQQRGGDVDVRPCPGGRWPRRSPATSVTMPPPTATTTSARERPARAKKRASSSTVASVLASSPSGMTHDLGGHAGVQSLQPAGVPDRLLRHERRPTWRRAAGSAATSWRVPAPTSTGYERSARSTERACTAASPPATVRARARRDGRAGAGVGAASSASTMRSATDAGSRSSTSITMSATSA